jgi:hypothetical protein
MKYSSHGNGNGLNDLYLLPETEDERKKVKDFLNEKGIEFTTWYSDVKGQDWYGKNFIDVIFGEYLKPELEKLMEVKCAV